MAIVSLDLGNAAQTNRIVNAIATTFGWPALVDGLPNPETKQAFAKRMVISWIKSHVRDQEAAVASKAAFDTAAADVETNVTIT